MASSNEKSLTLSVQAADQIWYGCLEVAIDLQDQVLILELNVSALIMPFIQTSYSHATLGKALCGVTLDVCDFACTHASCAT